MARQKVVICLGLDLPCCSGQPQHKCYRQKMELYVERKTSADIILLPTTFTRERCISKGKMVRCPRQQQFRGTDFLKERVTRWYYF